MKQPVTQILDFDFPDSTEMERQVLADAVNNPDCLGDIIPLVHPDFFTMTSRRKIWDTVVEYYNKGKAIDLVSISTVCGRDFIDEVLPVSFYTGGVLSCIEHVAHLRDLNAKRRAYYAATTFLQNALNPSTAEQDIIASTELFSRTVEGPAPFQNEAKLSTILEEVRKETEQTAALKQKGEKIRVGTGFAQLDYTLYGGFKPGQLVILGARPSVGKTAVMLHIAKTAAKASTPAYIFSLEMTAPELGERMLFSTGRVRPSQLSEGTVEWQAFTEAENELAPLPIFINDFSRSIDEIVTRLTQAVKQGRCGIAFIDYLGLIQDCLLLGGNLKLYQVIARITGTLKAVAKRLQIPIVLLCQMNREQVREKRSPELYDLRDSGSIEQDADVVIMLDPKPKDRQVIAWLRKNRSGKRDFGYVLEANETYSAFEEKEVMVPAGAEQLTETPPAPAPEPQPEQGTFRFYNEPEERDDNDLPF